MVLLDLTSGMDNYWFGIVLAVLLVMLVLLWLGIRRRHLKRASTGSWRRSANRRRPEGDQQRRPEEGAE